MENNRNWAGNFKYNASEVHAPETVEQVQALVASSKRIKVLGTRHSFNSIADTNGCHLSLQKLNRVVELDRTNNRVTVEAGIRYGELCHYLHSNGYALHNLASLPHISVGGAVATATHGSGDLNGNLATAVYSLEVVKADGETIVLARDQADGVFAGAVVGLGGLGVVTTITLDVVPSFNMSQVIYENLPLAQLENHFDAIFSSAYSVSLFTDWKSPSFNQLWMKMKLPDAAAATLAEPEFYGAKLAKSHLHPVPGASPVNCSEQMGIAGPWYERLPHFRMDFTPSAGEELQSEYFVPRKDAYLALCAINRLRDQISPYLHVSEIRTIAADSLWLSPCYKGEMVAIHFTWKDNWEAVQQLLPIIEEQLKPFHARPHWGKLFTMSPAELQSHYEKLPDFQQLLRSYDPEGKFRNDYITKYILGT
nr:FAD-binding protein [Paenibacillus sp. CF384]